MESESSSDLRVPEGYELRRVRPRKPAPLTHRDEAVRPFNSYEFDLLREWAPQMSWDLRPGAVGQGGRKRQGWGRDYVRDASFVWDTCQFLYASACHISKLPRIRPEQVERDPESGWLVVTFLRAKRTATNAVVRVPLPDDLDPWVRTYLAKPKPANRQAYDHMFRELSMFIESHTRPRPSEAGVRLHLNALRFRHSGLVRFKYGYGATDQAVATWAGCSLRTVQTYTAMVPPEVLKAIRSRGASAALFGPPT